MGTNYYWYPKPPCETCLRPYEPLHIGKSSAGWCFALHLVPEEDIESLSNWRDRFALGEVRDEYGRDITADEMVAIITDREWARAADWSPRVYESNHAEPGPNNLIRHKIGHGCIAHGDGTYDLIVGEFS